MVWPKPTHDSFKAHLSRLRHPGYSHCLRCGYSWKDVEPHSTHYEFDENGFWKEGCFPLCEGCWQILGSPEARIEYYATLIEHWETTGSPVPEEKRFAIGQAVANGG